METCAGKCAKYFLFIFNLIFVLAGAGVLGVGIWIRVDKDFEQILQIINLNLGSNLYVAAYVLIGFGAFVFVVGFFGCCGAVTENKFLLGVYIFFLALIFTGELGGGIAGAVYKNKILDGLRHSLSDTIQGYQTSEENRDSVTLAWDYVQVLFKCCGANNFTDYRSKYAAPDIFVPPSCCHLKNSDPNEPMPTSYKLCNYEASDPSNVGKKTDYLWSKNCVDGVQDILKSNMNVLIGVACGVAFLQFLGIALACCVCRGGGSKVYV